MMEGSSRSKGRYDSALNKSPYSRCNDQLHGIMPEKAILEIEEKKFFGAVTA
jgi:hypothetical protein